MKILNSEELSQYLKDEDVLLAANSNLFMIQSLDQQIGEIEKQVLKRIRLKPAYKKLLEIGGIGKILALTIMLETGEISRFPSVGNYASYCRMVDSKRESNGKKKGEGNKKNGNKYLCWAFIEAVNFAIRYNEVIKSYYQRKLKKTNRTLDELSLSDCDQFWLKWAEKISAYEKFKFLAITGGVPKYLEEIKPQLSAEENIRQLCFERAGLLFNEFDQIFSDIFSKRYTLYKEIVLSIMNGYFEYEEIYKKLGVEKSGLIGEYLNDLITSGFLVRDHTWHFKTGKASKLSRFRISDNYLRYYLKYILPNRDKIHHNAFENVALILLPQWEGTMGLQFENLVLHNRQRIHNILGIKPE